MKRLQTCQSSLTKLKTDRFDSYLVFFLPHVLFSVNRSIRVNTSVRQHCSLPLLISHVSHSHLDWSVGKTPNWEESSFSCHPCHKSYSHVISLLSCLSCDHSKNYLYVPIWQKTPWERNNASQAMDSNPPEAMQSLVHANKWGSSLRYGQLENETCYYET